MPAHGTDCQEIIHHLVVRILVNAEAEGKLPFLE